LDLNECSKVNNEVFLWLIDAKEQGADVTLQRMTVVWNKGTVSPGISAHSTRDGSPGVVATTHTHRYDGGGAT
jgi:hypothetical protein